MPEKIQSIHLDANESVFFARQLEEVKARTYDVRYPELKATQLIPVNTSTPDAARTITYQQYDQVGLAKIVGDYAKDFPRCDVKGKEFSSIVKSLGSSYGYNVQEIRSARLEGFPLEQRKANAARFAIEQLINRISWFGDAENQLLGFLNNPNVPVDTVAADGTGSSTEFEDKTPQQIVRDMNRLVHGIVEITKGVEVPTRLIMPRKQYHYIASTQFSNASDTTILEFFRNTNMYITDIEAVNELAGAGTAGADIMVAYNPSSDKLELELPVPFEQFPAQEKGTEFVIFCHARIGGVIVYYPLSLSIAEGI